MSNRKEDLRHPLEWPFGWKRTPTAIRRTSPFKEAVDVQRRRYDNATNQYQTVTVPGQKTVTMRVACTRLQEQLERLGATDEILSTNVELTIGGEPRGDRSPPTDVGVAVYFRLKGQDRVLACDKWATVPENICAIANHVDAIRRVDRYGVGTMEQAFAGYDRLSAPNEENRPSWRKTLGFRPMAEVTPDDVQVNYRSLAKAAGIDQSRILELNLAREAALREVR